MQTLEPEKKLGEIIPNIAKMLQQNVQRLGNKIAYQEKKEGEYKGISWNEFYKNIVNIAFNLKQYGFSKGDKIVLFSQNRLEMLELELAVMASGGVAVPIFAGFKQETAELLITHSDAKYLAVAGEHQLNNLLETMHASSLQKVFVFDNIDDKRFSNLTPFRELLKEKSDSNFKLSFDEQPDNICLNMYTSGTMGTPKCVQLTQKNILSQHAAREILWDINDNDRLLSYLPWHHSFGGIFELFTALCYGATLSLESSYGKDPEIIMENWKLIKPTIFFSVPKVYQALVDLTKESKEAEDLFFHSGLKFIFTAAAPLPEKLSHEFERRNIPVIEGWGLTETSPCCTLTDSKIKREAGVVGKPIPGISIRLGDDNEILIIGPNVMTCYYKNDKANADVFTKDGWFRTGDVGEFTKTGLKLIARKDRIFKLSNGEKVIPTDMEKLIEKKCSFISYALVTGAGEAYTVALLFPNRNLLDKSDHDVTSWKGCSRPRTLTEFAKCLHSCLDNANCEIMQKFARIKAAILIDDELSVENNTLTPSMKVAPNNVIKKYKVHLDILYGADFPVDEDVYVIKLK